MCIFEGNRWYPLEKYKILHSLYIFMIEQEIFLLDKYIVLLINNISNGKVLNYCEFQALLYVIHTMKTESICNIIQPLSFSYTMQWLWQFVPPCPQFSISLLACRKSNTSLPCFPDFRQVILCMIGLPLPLYNGGIISKFRHYENLLCPQTTFIYQMNLWRMMHVLRSNIDMFRTFKGVLTHDTENEFESVWNHMLLLPNLNL